MNINDLLTITTAIVPDRDAMVCEGRRFSYAQLQERANRLADALSQLGVGPGDRVATVQVNCNELVEACLAAVALDAVYVPLNFRARADELTFTLNDAEPKVLLVGQRYTDLVDSVRPRVKSVGHYVALEERHGDWPFYDDLLSQACPEERFPSAADDDLVVLLFTAGTTGTPKGVMLTHESFTSYILANVEPPDPETEEKNILTVPLYHVAGLQAVLSAIYGGRTLIVQKQFEPKEWMTLVQQERVDRAMLVPTMLKSVMEHTDFHNHDLSTLRVITYGAASMPLEVIKQAVREFPGCAFINAFGQTETASTITMLAPEDHIIPEDATAEELGHRMKRLTSIGKPLSDVEVRIVDEGGDDVLLGEVGEIVASGSRLMKGYWGQQDATQETMRAGWLYTGDLAYMDADGYIFLAGRAKDFIKRGGEMVSPEEVEQVLQSHPAVDEAAVIGVQDVHWGERVRAVVVPKSSAHSTAEELIEYCRDRLASFKRPESVVFVEELPRNPMGKVLKRVLREEHGQPFESETE